MEGSTLTAAESHRLPNRSRLIGPRPSRGSARCRVGCFRYFLELHRPKRRALRARVICASYACHETSALLRPIPIQAGPPRPRCQRHRSLYSPRCRYCVAHECSDRQRDRNILLSNRFSGGSLRVVVARAPRDLRPPMRVAVVTMMQPVRPARAACRLLRAWKLEICLRFFG
jgi:hypothetical protein